MNQWDLCGRNIFCITMNVFKMIFLKLGIRGLALTLTLIVDMVIKLWSGYIISLELSSFYVTWKRRTRPLNFLLTLKCYIPGFLENKNQTWFSIIEAEIFVHQMSKSRASFQWELQNESNCIQDPTHRSRMTP